MSDVMFQVQVIMIHFEHLAKMAIVEMVFLYGEHEVEIYVECPPGMKGIGKYDCHFG